MSARQNSVRFVAALASGASLFALGYGPAAVAQKGAQGGAQPSASVGGLEEVVVTARRKEEKAQSVPIIVNTFAATTLQNEGIKTIRDLASTVPSLSMTGTRQTTVYLWLRGIVGAVQYFNEVPTINYGGFSLGFDLANVQVLKGPQGTLFGQSADAGAILYSPHQTTNSFEGFARAEAGTYGHRSMEGVVNVPILDDRLVVRLGLKSDYTDGYIKDVVTGQQTGKEDYWIGRGIITWRPTEEIQNDLLLNYYSSRSTPNTTVGWTVWNSPLSNSIKQYGPGVVQSTALNRKLGWYDVAQGQYRPGGVFSSVQNYIITNTTRWDINDNLTLKNIAGYQEWAPGVSNTLSGNYDVRQYPLSAATLATLLSHPLAVPAVLTLYTEEIQLQGRALDDKLSYTFGNFNSFGGTRTPKQGPNYTAQYSLTGGSVAGSMAWGQSRTNGLFFQGTYDLAAFAEGLSLTLGYRYTWDKQVLTTQTFKGDGVRSTSVTQLAWFKAPSYNISLDYQMTPNTLLYATLAKGYSRGGFNGGNAAFSSTSGIYTPESVTNHEIGVKTDYEVFGMKARTNLGLFYEDYAKVQGISTQLVASPVPGVLPAAQAITVNAATATVKGLDLEVTIVPTDDLSISAAGGYVNFHYDTWINPLALTLVNVSTTDWSGIPQYYTPQLSYNVRATYRLPFLDWVAPGQDMGEQSLTATYVWNGHIYSGLAGPGQQSDQNIAPSYDVVTLNMNWRDMFGKVGLDGRMYVTNLLENTNFVNNGGGYIAYGSVGRVPYQPRMWGFSFQYNFGE